VQDLGPDGSVALRQLNDMVPRVLADSVSVIRPALVYPGLHSGNIDDLCCGEVWSGCFGAVLVLCPERIDRDGHYEYTIRGLRERNIEVLVWPVSDCLDNDIIEGVLLSPQDGVLAWIAGFLEENKRVLVLCWDGMNRGAAIVVGFMVFYARRALLQAVRVLMQTHGAVLTHRGLRVQLVRACLDHGRPLGSAPTLPGGNLVPEVFYADL
jgi:hypothetical protein